MCARRLSLIWLRFKPSSLLSHEPPPLDPLDDNTVSNPPSPSRCAKPPLAIVGMLPIGRVLVTPNNPAGESLCVGSHSKETAGTCLPSICSAWRSSKADDASSFKTAPVAKRSALIAKRVPHGERRALNLVAEGGSRWDQQSATWCDGALK